jgi:enamine deaminase RidA (YjgF/YER057c/UK114 family)
MTDFKTVSLLADGRVMINPEGRNYTGMTQGVGVGSFTFVSGQVSIAPDGSVVGAGDAEAQAKKCFENLAGVLAERGTGLPHVVKLTCYLTDVEHYGAYAAAKNAVFPEDPPASTTVIVSGLLYPELLMEIEAIAVYDGD